MSHKNHRRKNKARKPYRGSRAFDPSCRDKSCPACQQNHAHSTTVRVGAAKNSLDEFIKKELPKIKPGPFKPTVFYNREGDLLEVYLSNESHYARWISPQLTALHSQKSYYIV